MEHSTTFRTQVDILFGDDQLGEIFEQVLSNLRFHHGKEAPGCFNKDGQVSVLWNLNMYVGKRYNMWIDSLQSVWPAILVSYLFIPLRLSHRRIVHVTLPV